MNTRVYYLLLAETWTFWNLLRLWPFGFHKLIVLFWYLIVRLQQAWWETKIEQKYLIFTTQKWSVAILICLNLMPYWGAVARIKSLGILSIGIQSKWPVRIRSWPKNTLGYASCNAENNSCKTCYHMLMANLMLVKF